MKNDFCVFILTYGRVNKVITEKTLKRCGYTGLIYYVVSDDDEMLADYKAKYGDKVLVFNKDEIAKSFDLGDNFENKKTIVFARNVCFVLAERLGIKYFLELDDDYTAFAYKFNTDYKYEQRPIKDLDSVFEALLDFYKSTNCLSIAMAQNGDFIGGKDSGLAKDIGTKRKAMNSFFCSTDRKFKFLGRINEDVNTYVNLGNRGYLFLTILGLVLNQNATQKTRGGMTETYIDSGTYVKSFYSVMYNPGSVKIYLMGDKHLRMHHQISWNNTAPRILRETYRKTY